MWKSANFEIRHRETSASPRYTYKYMYLGVQCMAYLVMARNWLLNCIDGYISVLLRTKNLLSLSFFLSPPFPRLLVDIEREKEQVK